MNHRSPQQHDITDLIRAWTDGKDGASDALAQQVYDELYRIANQQLQREKRAELEPSELVHEAWLRMGQSHLAFATRGHFFAFASLQMRRLLTDLARAAARPGPHHQITLTLQLADPAPQPADLVVLGNVLEQLDQLDPRKAQAFALAQMGGFKHDEIAQILDVSLATLERDLRFARVWLAARLA